VIDSALKIVFLTPYYHQGRGNATTARRLEFGLKGKGINLFVFAYEEETYSKEIKERIEKADVVHVLQFARFSRWLKNHPVPIQNKLVITSGGTDINQSLKSEQSTLKPLLNDAMAITVFSAEAKKYLVEEQGFHENKIFVIPQSLYLPENPRGNENSEGWLPKGNPRILLPAGLRPVKDVLYAVPAIKRLHAHFPDIVFLILGACLDGAVYEQVQEAKKRYEWLYYSPEIDLTLMKEVYQWSDIVLNTSESEGQPTSLLEAMSQHKPVAARNIDGNSSIICHGENGLLFNSRDELYEELRKLLLNKSYSQSLSSAGYETVKQKHSLEKEIDAYIKIYKRIKESSF
jgi:glycosyltransferase involved in cell wall biosynthesis